MQYVLMKMEKYGFPVSEKVLKKTLEDSEDIRDKLEKKIFALHGRRFDINSRDEVKKVLGANRNIQLTKTNRQVLKKLDIPIGNLIDVWRTLKATIDKMNSIFKVISGGRIHGSSNSFTATGRITMAEPNVQGSTKDFRVEFEGEF